MELARLYPSNPNIKNTHGRCLARETDLNGMERAIPSPPDAWLEQLPETLREIARGDHYAPEFQTGDPQHPHRNDIRDAADGRARIVQIPPEGETVLLISEVTRREAARDAHPLATYFHAKQSYSILGWRETRGEHGDHGAPCSAAGDPAHHPQWRNSHAVAAPRFWAGPPGILHPCPGGGLGTDRRLRRARTGGWGMAGGPLRRGGYPRGDDQPAHHGHPDHCLGGVVRRCQRAAGRGPGPPDGDVGP